MRITKRTALIHRFLLAAVKAGNQRLIPDAMETFGISRQALHGHLSALVKLGRLEALGNTRARYYVLGPNRAHHQSFALKGLSESDVYHRHFGFMFKDLPRQAEDICDYGFTEMLNNAIDHSGGSTVHVSVDRSTENIEILIEDDGEGIFKHIARKLKLADPRESILELSKGKLTTDPKRHSGQGIFFTSRAFDDFAIQSDGLIFTHGDTEEFDVMSDTDTTGQGTQVYMRIATNSSKTLKAVFDEYTGSEEEDYAFNKTAVQLTLALSEGERLVSRSQAKRILNRVDKFKTVMLDFKGVDAIGQA
ncbi:MAG: ATP-binding protein, partial [Gammaproteobacteria bacterium]|nr:ATP-binding protein [Gammaproteobacteria bacterium]